MIIQINHFKILKFQYLFKISQCFFTILNSIQKFIIFLTTFKLFNLLIPKKKKTKIRNYFKNLYPNFHKLKNI